MTTLSSKIATNTFLQIVGRTVGTLLGLFSIGLLTRYLGPSGYGAFTTITGFLQFFGIVVDLGLTLIAVQMISEEGADERKIMGNILTLRLVTALIFFGLAPLVALLFPYPPLVKVGILVGSLAFLFMTQNQVIVGIFQKHLSMGRAAVAEVAGRIILFLGILLVVLNGWGLIGSIWVLVVGNAVQLLLSFIFADRLVPLRFLRDFEFMKQILKRSWPIGLSIAFNLIYLKGDIIFLSVFRSQAEVGFYGAAYKILDVITVIPMMFMGLVLPILTHAWGLRDLTLFARRLQKSFDFLMILAVPIVGGAWVVGKNLMVLVAGQDYRTSGNLLTILIVAAGAVFVSGLFGHIIVAIGKQRSSVWGYAINAVLSLIGYVVFVPRFGAPAAAWVTVFSEVFIAIFTAVLVIRVTRIRPRLGTAFKIIVATSVMSLVLLTLPNWSVLISIMVGVIVYGIVLVVLRVISRETIREFLPSLNR